MLAEIIQFQMLMGCKIPQSLYKQRSLARTHTHKYLSHMSCRNELWALCSVLCHLIHLVVWVPCSMHTPFCGVCVCLCQMLGFTTRLFELISQSARPRGILFCCSCTHSNTVQLENQSTRFAFFLSLKTFYWNILACIHDLRNVVTHRTTHE